MRLKEFTQGVAEGSLEEIDRRGFLKGAGATAAAAAASQATAGLPLFVPIPNPTQSDPPLKLSLRLPWKHKHENLTKEDQRIIANLIHILYLARMTEQQDLYQLAYTTISEINDAFADVDIGKSMNFFKKRLENAQTSNPNQFDQFSKYFLNPSVYDKIIAAGKKLATDGPGAVTQEPQQSQPSKTFETMMIDRMLRLYFYAKQANDPVQVDVMRLLTLYNMSKNASAQSPKDAINIPERYNKLQKELSGNSDIQERLSRQHLANAQQIMAEFKKTFATTQQVDPDLEQKRRENLQRMQGIASQDSPTKESVNQGVAEGKLDEGWKSALGAAAIAGTMAMGGGAHARVSGDYVDNPEINRLTGQPKVTQQISPDTAKPAAAKPGFSKEYLQSVVDGTHPRPLISKERAQELLQQQTTNEQSKQQKGADYRDPPEADYGDDYQDMVARVKKLAGLGPLKTVYDPTKRVYRNVPTAVQPKK